MEDEKPSLDWVYKPGRKSARAILEDARRGDVMNQGVGIPL